MIWMNQDSVNKQDGFINLLTPLTDIFGGIRGVS